MQALLLLLCIMGGVTNCGKKKEEQHILASPRKAELQSMFDSKASLAISRRSKDGWLGTDKCDAMLFTGKYSCAAEGVDIAAAEYTSQPGRFNRRPAPFCEANAGSQTSWSRDMGMGLFTYAWCNKDLPVLERHASYGESKTWKMGEPLADGRVVYTPSVIGHLYQAIYTLGGKDNVNRTWPSIYSAGLTDFEAHLQMMDIWLRGEMSQRQTDLGLIGAGTKKEVHYALEISALMADRVSEHSNREQLCPFYQYLKGLYASGNLNSTVDLLLSNQWTCEYFHTSDRDSDVYLAEWLFAAKLVLKKI